MLKLPIRTPLRLLPFVLVTQLFVSCFGPQPVDEAFKARRNQKVAVVTMQAPVATMHHVGNQGLLDMAVNAAVSSGRRKGLAGYPSQAKLDEVGKNFAKRLSGYGYKADFVSVHPTFKDFNPTIAKPSASKPVHGTGSYLNGYDAVVYVSMPAVGRSQMVYAFIPLSGSHAIAPLQGSMFSTADQKRLWRAPLQPIDPSNGVSIEGDASQSENLYRAIDSAMKNSSDKLQNHFFEGF